MRAEMGLVKLAQFSGVSQTTLHRVKQAQTASDLKLMASSIEKITIAVQRHNSGEEKTTIQPVRQKAKKAKRVKEPSQEDPKGVDDLTILLLRQLVDYPKDVVKEVLQMVSEIYE